METNAPLNLLPRRRRCNSGYTAVANNNGYSLFVVRCRTSGFVSNRSQYFPTHERPFGIKRWKYIPHRPYIIYRFLVDIYYYYYCSFSFGFYILYIYMYRCGIHIRQTAVVTYNNTIFPSLFAFRSNTFFGTECRWNVESNIIFLAPRNGSLHLKFMAFGRFISVYTQPSASS